MYDHFAVELNPELKPQATNIEISPNLIYSVISPQRKYIVLYARIVTSFEYCLSFYFSLFFWTFMLLICSEILTKQNIIFFTGMPQIQRSRR